MISVDLAVAYRLLKEPSVTQSSYGRVTCPRAL